MQTEPCIDGRQQLLRCCMRVLQLPHAEQPVPFRLRLGIYNAGMSKCGRYIAQSHLLSDVGLVSYAVKEDILYLLQALRGDDGRGGLGVTEGELKYPACSSAHSTDDW